MAVLTILGDRLIQSFTTLPDLTAWEVCLALFVGYGAIALPVGRWSGLLTLEWVTSWTTVLTTAVVTLVFPSLVEEILFRVLLLPHPAEQASLGAIALWSLGSLVIFVAAHPLNALLVMTSRRNTFWDPWFLLLAALLGGICTVTYIQSGSLWLPVFLHWLIVMIWLLCLGGDRRMRPNPAPDKQGVTKST